MKPQVKYNQVRSTKLTDEEKRNYCLKWAHSGQNKTAFCQSVGISKSAFYSWCHQFQQELAGLASDAVFSPVALNSTSKLETENLIQLEICLPNQTKLLISMQKLSLVSFIQELSHAATIIR
jgi:transposase-like protein